MSRASVNNPGKGRRLLVLVVTVLLTFSLPVAMATNAAAQPTSAPTTPPQSATSDDVTDPSEIVAASAQASDSPATSAVQTPPPATANTPPPAADAPPAGAAPQEASIFQVFTNYAVEVSMPKGPTVVIGPDGPTLAPAQPGEMETIRRRIPALCSGGLYSERGDIITADHCTNPKVLEGEIQSFFGSGSGGSPFDPDTLPEASDVKVTVVRTSIKVYQPEGTAGRCIDRALPVTQLGQIDFRDGDLAHLKLDAMPTDCVIPALKIATVAPLKREVVTALGFPGSVSLASILPKPAPLGPSQPSATPQEPSSNPTEEPEDPGAVLETDIEDSRTGVSIVDGKVTGFPVIANRLQTIQTDTPTEQGTSGCPLLNSRGEVVGIASFSTEPSGDTNQYVHTDRLRNFALHEGIISQQSDQATTQNTPSVSDAAQQTSDQLDSLRNWVIALAVLLGTLILGIVAVLIGWANKQNRERKAREEVARQQHAEQANQVATGAPAGYDPTAAYTHDLSGLRDREQ